MVYDKVSSKQSKDAQSVFWRIQVGEDDQEGCLKKVGSAEEEGEAETDMGMMGSGKYCEPRWSRVRTNTASCI